MKKFIIFIVLSILISVSIAQQINYRKSLQLKKLPALSLEFKFRIAVKSILANYGKSFKYWDNLQSGNYKLLTNSKNKDEYFLAILDKSNLVLDKIKLKINKSPNGNNELIYDVKDMQKYIDITKLIFSKQFNSFEQIIERDSILNDQIIINGPEGQPYKVLNNNLTNHALVSQYGEDEPSILYNLLDDMVIIPYGEGSHSKVLSVDSRFHSIIYYDADVANMSPSEPVSKYYGKYGNKIDNGRFSHPSGIIYGRSYESGNEIVYSTFVSDLYHNRIIKVDYRFPSDGSKLGYFDNESFSTFSDEVRYPYDIQYFTNDSDLSNDKIWVSEAHPLTPSLVCLNMSGEILHRIRGIRLSNNELFLFDKNMRPRISVYNEGFGCIAFIMSNESKNVIVSFLLDNNGEPSSMYNDSIVDPACYQNFNSDYKLGSIAFQRTTASNALIPYLWVTSGGYYPPYSESNSLIHVFYANKTGNFQYLASTRKPRNTDNEFVNLMNLALNSNYYDIFTVEEWSYSYGVRRYIPFASVHTDNITAYCEDSVNQLLWKAVFTNECNIRVWAERKKNLTEWEQVEISMIDGEIKPPGTIYADIFRFKGYTAIIGEDPIEIRLKLPLKDYVFGDSIKIHAKIFPEWNIPDNSNNYTYREYTTYVKKTCLPRPGGCPFLYVTDVNKDYKTDNNILHRSEFSADGDITDKYKLRVTPHTADNNIELSLVENENDYGYINMVKLYAVDYPSTKKMAITEDNQIVLYDSASVLASDSVMLNSTNITGKVNFHNPGPNPVVGYNGDQMYAHFTNPDVKTKLNIENNFSDKPVINERKGKEKANNKKEKNLNIFKTDGGSPESIAFITELSNHTYPNTANKNYAGRLTAISIFSNQVDKYFARRELSSVVVIPLFNDTDKVDNININWLSDFRIKYLGVTNNLLYDGFTVTEAPMYRGRYITSTLDSNIIDALSNVDEYYGEVSSTGLIKMTFDISNLPSISKTDKRDFVIEVNGRYYRGNDSRLTNFQQPQVPLTFKLSQNYPNPFNPNTKINFDIPKTTKVSLVIYDILGRKVITLVNNEIKEAGRYMVNFDGTNYASGVYFYRIEAGDFVESKKMVLIK